MKKKMILIGFVILTSIQMLCSCQSAPARTSEPVSQAEPVSVTVEEGTLGVQSGFSTLPAQEYASYMSGAFACDIMEYDTPSEPLQELLAGNLDLCVAPLPAVIEAQAEGSPVKILCNFFQKGAAVVGLVDGEIETFQDLPGKTVGYAEGSTEYTLLQLTLQENSIDPDSINWVSMLPSEYNNALLAEEIDAYCGDAATAGTAIIENFGKIVCYPYLDTLGMNNLVLATTDSVIEEKRDWLQEMVDTNRTVMEMVAQNQDWYLDKAEELGLDTQAIQVEKDNFQWLWDMEEEYVIYARNMASEMLSAGLIEEMPDFNLSFDFTFLEKTNQEYLQ